MFFSWSAARPTRALFSISFRVASESLFWLNWRRFVSRNGYIKKSGPGTPSTMVRRWGQEERDPCKSFWYSYSPGIMFLTTNFLPAALCFRQYRHIRQVWRSCIRGPTLLGTRITKDCVAQQVFPQWYRFVLNNLVWLFLAQEARREPLSEL